MPVFDFGALSAWRGVDREAIISFEADEGQYRQVDIDVLAPDGTEVHVIMGDSFLSLGHVSRLVTLRYGAQGTSGLSFLTPEGFDHVLVRTKAQPLVISETGAVSLTKAEPRKASGVEQEMRRLMMLMQMRSEQRIAEREAELARRFASAPSSKSSDDGEVIERGGDDAGTAE